MTNDLSLYFHIPFCVRKCAYCAFYSVASCGEELKQSYYEALIRHMSFLEDDRKIKTVYFGGGTPPVLGVDRLCKLIKSVGNRFDLTEKCEITVEVNPGTVTYGDLLDLKSAGANRLSVGVQTSDDVMLTKLGRLHDFAKAKSCIADAFSAGFGNVSADLIFALPGTDRFRFEKVLSDFALLGVQHVSAYSLQLEPGTKLYTERDDLVFPGEDDEEAQYETLCSSLAARGMRHYEVSSFALPGYESVHNLAYWRRSDYFGFGSSAHSFYRGVRFSSPPSVKGYVEKSSVSLYAPTDREIRLPLTREEAAEETVMLGLRTFEGALISPEKRAEAERIARIGYGSFDGERLILNDRGYRVSNSIIARLI